jgi:GYF domain 2
MDLTFVGWYYLRDGQPFGPVAQEEIDRLIAAGRLKPHDTLLKAWKEGSDLHLFRSEVASTFRGKFVLV